MSSKAQILERLGESAVLIPELIGAGLMANERAKLRLTMLQDALAHGQNPAAPLRDLSAERRQAGLDDARFDAAVTGAQAVGTGRVAIPGSRLLIAGLFDDLEAMRAPLAASPAGQEFAARLRALRQAAPRAGDDIVAASEISALSKARRGNSDSAHLLIMDLHKALNRLAAESAVEMVAGARVHGVNPDDRERIAAFMRGLNRTASLAFGHPGLGTTATRSGERLVIQNDIGTTEAHVLVVHVEATTVAVTYTDVHRARAEFFISLFAGRNFTWSPLNEDTSGLGKDSAFFLVTGTYIAEAQPALDAMLEFLGSRIVFLIDWNKARKALQTFTGKRAAVEVLEWSATHDYGHRAFLELGGTELIFEAIRHVAAGRVPYGARLDNVLDSVAATEFLKSALRIASEGLASGRSARLIRDEIQAELTQCFETAESALYTVVLRHLGLSRMLAGLIADAMSGGHLASAAERKAIAAQSKRLEHKADGLALEARELAQRLIDDRGHLRPAADAIEQATDALDDAAFFLSLFPDTPPGRLIEPVAALADIATASVADLVRSIEAAARLPEGARVDAVAALQGIDAVIEAEKSADDLYRTAVGAILARPGEARLAFIAIELARALESATDQLARAALSLRDRVIEELSA